MRLQFVLRLVVVARPVNRVSIEGIVIEITIKTDKKARTKRLVPLQ